MREFQMVEKTEKGENQTAFNNLGMCYFEGEGVERNSSKDMDYFASCTPKEASCHLSTLLAFNKRGEGVQRLHKAVQLLEKAIREGRNQ